MVLILFLLLELLAFVPMALVKLWQLSRGHLIVAFKILASKNLPFSRISHPSFHDPFAALRVSIVLRKPNTAEHKCTEMRVSNMWPADFLPPICAANTAY
jgi:hypothetical protein